MSPLEASLVAQHQAALADAERRIEAFKRALERSQRQTRALSRLFIAMFLITLAALAFSVGVLTQWLA